MTIIPNFLTAKSVNGLDTFQYTVITPAMHVARIQLNELPPSSVSVVIQHNGSPVATAPAPTPGQSNIDLSVAISCAANDTISFVVSSSNPADKALNVIKSMLNVHIGTSN